MERCRRMKRQQSTSRNWTNSWPWKSSRIRQLCCRSESFARITDIHMSGQWSKTMSHQKRCSHTMQYGKLRPNRGPRVIDDFFFVKLVWLKHLQHQYRRKVLGQNLFQHQLDVRVKTWQHSGYSPTCAKQKLPRRPSRTSWRFLETTRKPNSHLHWQFLGILQILRGIILESLYVNTTQIRIKWDCWESSTQSERSYVCGVVAIRSGWRMVGRFHGMLYLSARIIFIIRETRGARQTLYL